VSEELILLADVRYRLGLKKGIDELVALGYLTIVSVDDKDYVKLDGVLRFEEEAIEKKKALRYLNLEPGQVRTWIRVGYLVVLPITSRVYYTRESVEKLKKFLSERLIVSDALAKHGQLTREGILQGIKRGDLAGVRAGGRWFVLRSELEDMARKAATCDRSYVAERLSLSCKQVGRLVTKGYLGAERTIAGKVRYTDAMVKDFLDTYGNSDFYLAMKEKHRRAQ
jgi:hypothetical protein